MRVAFRFTFSVQFPVGYPPGVVFAHTLPSYNSPEVANKSSTIVNTNEKASPTDVPTAHSSGTIPILLSRVTRFIAGVVSFTS